VGPSFVETTEGRPACVKTTEGRPAFVETTEGREGVRRRVGVVPEL